MRELAVLAAASTAGGQLTIVIGTATAIVAALGTLVMLGPNRRSKAMEIAEKGITIAAQRADQAEHEEAEMKRKLAEAEADLVIADARIEALTRQLDALRARLREAHLDDA